MDFYRHLLVADGLCLTRYNKVGFLYRPGDFVLTPHPDESRPVSISDVSFDESGMYKTELVSITVSTLAHFDKDAIDELLSDPNFLRASCDNSKDLYSHVTAFLIAMNSSSAYDAVTYVLKYCYRNGINHLTHQQIATITGHSRTTVTSIMHETVRSPNPICCASPGK